MEQQNIGREFERFREAGDPEALTRVFDATAQPLLLLAVHLTRDGALAEDLVQTTIVSAVERAATFETGMTGVKLTYED